jgi:acetoin utilization protein AcuB
MFVSKSMTTTIITVSPSDNILDAKKKMKENHIRHLPVVDATQHLLGIITDRDIRSAMPSSMLHDPPDISSVSVGDIMTKKPITLSGAHTIQDALLMIQETNVGAFPVVDDQNRLIGILSIRDILKAFTNIMGIGEPGTLLGILVDQKVGQMKKIVDAITEENISFGSILVARYWDTGKRAVFPYLLTNNVVTIKKKLVALGFELISPMEWNIDQQPK